MKILVLWVGIFTITSFIPENHQPPFLIGTLLGIYWTLWFTNTNINGK